MECGTFNVGRTLLAPPPTRDGVCALMRVLVELRGKENLMSEAEKNYKEIAMSISDRELYEYRTKSLDEFAVALAMGAEVVAVDRVSDDRFFTFTLRGDFDIESIALQLASKTLSINAADLCEAMKRAKSVVHSR